MVARHVFTTAGCSHCRLAVLKLFAGPTTIIPIVRPTSLRCRPRSITPSPIRVFSSRTTQDEPSNNKESDEEGLEGEDNEVLNSQEHDDAAKGSELTNVPWYLQVEPPRHVASIEPPPLPEVPSGSPEIIGPLLEYVSEELGLDELSLLDLREVNPPPALGPNLFMLFGTARSERHLNVSGGRLVRWLRAKHRVYAHADGLLGPNERKTKLRRKAKRAKLLGGAEDTDDGIKTGWICVNLGTIGASNKESTIVAEDGRVAGFGVAQGGFTVVVQIMTESRRAEMGLEALWKQALGQPVEDPSESRTEILDNLHPLEKALLSSSRRDTAASNSHFNNTSRRTPFEQTRFYSTQTTVGEGLKPDLLTLINSESALTRMLKLDFSQKRRVLELLQVRLGTLPIPTQESPNISSEQQFPKEFLELSTHACAALPPHETWGFRLAVEAKICEFGKLCPSETRDNVRQLLGELCLYGIEATREQYLQLLACIYSCEGGGFEEKTELALQLLKTVHQRGQPVLANDIVVTIIEAVTRFTQRSESQDYLGLIRRLEDIMFQTGLPCMDEPLLMRLMTVYVELHNWEGLWNVWRMPPRFLRPRSAAMYIHMYKLVTDTRSAPLCILTLRRCFQEMLAENPPVPPTGAVLRALVECVRIADPNAEKKAAIVSTRSTATNESQLHNEFVKIILDLQLRDSGDNFRKAGIK